MVEKCEAVKRECACRGAIRLPDEQSEEPCEARSSENPNHRSFYSCSSTKNSEEPKQWGLAGLEWSFPLDGYAAVGMEQLEFIAVALPGKVLHLYAARKEKSRYAALLPRCWFGVEHLETSVGALRDERVGDDSLSS